MARKRSSSRTCKGKRRSRRSGHRSAGCTRTTPVRRTENPASSPGGPSQGSCRRVWKAVPAAPAGCNGGARGTAARSSHFLQTSPRAVRFPMCNGRSRRWLSPRRRDLGQQARTQPHGRLPLHLRARPGQSGAGRTPASSISRRYPDVAHAASVVGTAISARKVALYTGQELFGGVGQRKNCGPVPACAHDAVPCRSRPANLVHGLSHP